MQNKKPSLFVFLFTRLALPLDKVGGGSEKQNKNPSLFVFLFTRLALPLFRK